MVGRSSLSDLVVLDQFLSRRHARIFWQGGTLMVEDLQSRNGTFLNDQILHHPHALGPEDVVRLSGSSLTIGDIMREEKLTGEHRISLEQTVFTNASDILNRLKAPAPEQQQDPASIKRFLEHMRIINDVHMALGQWMSLAELMQLILDRIFYYLKPQEGVIYLKQGNGQFIPTASRAANNQHVVLKAPQSLVDEVAQKGQAAIVYDTATDERFSASDSILSRGIRCLIAAPLMGPEGSMGMIVLSSQARTMTFSQSDLDLLVSLASVAALRIHTAELAEEAAQRQRLEEELTLARRIQVALLPAKLPSISGFSLYAVNFPSHGVSGDYYEVVKRKNGKEYVLMIADVSGKGISASLLTASLEALAAAPIEDGLPPDTICEKLSRLLYQRTPPERYATLFMLQLTPGKDQIVYCNAGHLPGLVLRQNGTVERLGVTGVPIGLLRASSYKLGQLQMKKGETLVLYTDGITEALNREKQEFGIERLAELMSQHRDKVLAEMVDQLEADLRNFSFAGPSDDRTILLLRRE